MARGRLKRKKWKKAKRRYERSKQAVSDAQRQDLQPDISFDAGLERFLSSQQREGDIAMADATEQRSSLMNSYFDPNNPFSQQALLEKSIGDTRKAQVGQFASRGRLYSGGLEHELAQDAYQGQKGRDDLSRNYGKAVTGIERGFNDKLSGLQSESEKALWSNQQRRADDLGATAAPSFAELGLNAQGGKIRKPKKKNFRRKPGR